jgi:hypothetical protein
MRYEHLSLDLSTAACDALHDILWDSHPQEYGDSVRAELLNLENLLLARLQRTDPDPKADLTA